VILKNHPVREADIVYTVYTQRFGLVHVLGRSVRKGKLSMGMSLFSLVEFGFIQGKSYNTLTDVSCLHSFAGARESLLKLSLFYRLAETVLFLIYGEEKEEDVFHLLVGVMEEVERKQLSSREASLIRTYFSFRLLDILGYRPRTDGCVICSRNIDKEAYFSPSKGGTVCKNCSFRSIFVGDIEVLRSFLREDMDSVMGYDHRLLERVLEQYLYSLN